MAKVHLRQLWRNILANNGYKVALFDADIGLANLDVILKAKIGKIILHVLKGEATINEIIVPIIFSPNSWREWR